MRLSIVGLGKLGAPMAAVMADKGHSVIGVDLSPATIKSINDGEAPVDEPGLARLIAKNRHRLSATNVLEQAVAGTDATFIIVPTPSEADGAFSLRSVLGAAESIGGALLSKSTYHVVVLSSTVMPGSTGGKLLPLLERVSGKLCGRDFGLCYNPEFVSLGSVVRDMLLPDMILIGEYDQRSGDMLTSLYRSVCENQPAIFRMNFVNAELTKLAVNTFVTTKISYANMLAQVCETLPGADVDVVTAALGSDSRVGRKYLKGALGYGGPCFPRDNLAFSAMARQRGVPATLAEATEALNRRQSPRLANFILKRLRKDDVVGIAGLSYKPETSVVEESQGLALAACLLSKGVPVVVYDPIAMGNARPHLAGRVTFADSLEQCLARANILVITTPWEQFKGISPSDLNYSNGLPIVIDCWRILSGQEFEKSADYVALGVGVERRGEVDPVFGSIEGALAQAEVQGG
jgi:UDPglucose 6-dehydrogenase